MNKIHCSVAYHELALDKIEAFALLVKAGYFGNNPPFTVLPMTEMAFGTLITTFDSKYTDYKNGGLAQKPAFLIAKTALMDGLDMLATQTDLVAVGNSETILLAGFVPTKTGGESVKPGQCVVTVKRGISLELISTCIPIPGVTHYGCIMTEANPLPDGIFITGDGKIIFPVDQNPGPPLPTDVKSYQFDFNNQREKHFQNLKHNVLYYFYYYAVNPAGVGPLSDAVSLLAF